jgi:16S rRNA (guanine1207-N2)-methyltransferase
MDKDVYFHKTVTFRAGKQQLEFRTSQELFSSYDIDIGTRFLLRSIVEGGYQPKHILDLGCGYGPLGLTLKKIYPESTVHMVDRDALAIEYSRQNTEINRLDDVDIYGSLGYDDVKRDDFDLIASNIPGKAGEAIISYLMREARYYLTPGGRVSIVIVAALEAKAAKILQETPGCEIMLQRNRSGHAIFNYRFRERGSTKPDQSAFERGVYRRNDIQIHFQELEYSMQTANGLPEFSSLSDGSKMVIKALKKLQGQDVKRAIVLNPRQGHTAMAISKFIHPGTIELVDRDLLALRYARLNLIWNECPPDKINIYHQVGLERKDKEKVDLIAGVLRDEGKEAIFLTIRQAIEQVSSEGKIIVSGGSTAITRLVHFMKSRGELHIRTQERRRGQSLLVLERML